VHIKTKQKNGYR